MLSGLEAWDDTKTELQGRGWSVLDDLIGDEHRKAINNMLHGGGWTFGWKSDAADHFSFWHRHFGGNAEPDNNVRGAALPVQDCADAVRRVAPDIHALWLVLADTMLQGHRLVRCYANGSPYGAEGSIHTDSKAANSYTTIFFPHQRWEPNWGGETVLFNADRSDSIASIYPKPNRLFTFRGTIPHVARGVARVCPVLRVTLMFKTELCRDQ